MTERRSRRRPRPALKALFALGALAQLGQAQVCDQAALSSAAQSLLSKNYNAELKGTVPSTTVGPSLFATDSAFAAYAYSHFDIAKGMAEIQAILAAQWSNGLIPKIQFAPSSSSSTKATWLQGTVFPSATVWQVPPTLVDSSRSTAGLAATPWFAYVAMQLFNENRNNDGLNFLSSIFKPIYNYHIYLHSNRDAGGGLVYSYHPWESDLPLDSPIWAEVLQSTADRIAATGWACPYDLTNPSALPGAPSEAVLKSEMFLVELLANASYDDALVKRSSPYLSVDVQFNTVLAASDMALASIAKTLQLHSTSTVDDQVRGVAKGWADTAQSRLGLLWDKHRFASLLVKAGSQPVSDQPPAVAVKKQAHLPPPPPLRRSSTRGGGDPPSPPNGTFSAIDVVSNFSPLFVGSGVASSALVQGLIFQMLTPGIPASFDCPSHTYRLPTSACSVQDPQVSVSVLQNFIVQRGLARNQDGGLNAWLLNETLNRMCNASMDPFSAGTVSGPFHFSLYFSPLDGSPRPDMWGPQTTLAAGVAMALLHPDAKSDASDAPPISHDATFALVVIELIIAFATGVSCFVFSLNLFRKLQGTDSDAPIPMLNVQEIEEEGDNISDSGGGGATSHYYTFPEGTEPPAGPGDGAPEDLRRSESGHAAVSSGGGGLWGAARTYAALLKFW